MDDGCSRIELVYGCSSPPLEAVFDVMGGYYNGQVNCGNLFLQTDIPAPPRIRFSAAKRGRFYLLLLIDLDGNALGSYPDAVPAGDNSPIRHWIVGNIPGETLLTTGYTEASSSSSSDEPQILQPYRAPHIPVVSDRYGFFLFEQTERIKFAPLVGDVTRFDYGQFLAAYKLGQPVARNFFVALFVSESPFSGKAFKGNDVAANWHRTEGKGTLIRANSSS